jgi:hypothetical protein
LSDFENTLLEIPEIEWIKLKIFDEHNLAVGLYRTRHTRTGRIFVSVYRFSKEVFMDCETQSAEVLPGTSQSFKKRDLKIARWYYKQLCKSFKDGIVVWNGSRRTSLGRWD